MPKLRFVADFVHICCDFELKELRMTRVVNIMRLRGLDFIFRPIYIYCHDQVFAALGSLVCFLIQKLFIVQQDDFFLNFIFQNYSISLNLFLQNLKRNSDFKCNIEYQTELRFTIYFGLFFVWWL